MNLCIISRIRFLYPILALTALLLTGCGSSRRAVSTGDKPGTTVTDSKAGKAADNKVAQALVREARSWRGVPYVYGGHSRKGADCSGFLMEVYKAAAGIKLPRSSRDQKDFCKPISRDKMAVGDILFFTSKNSRGKIAHVGMYVGNNRMIHASSSRGVVEDDLSLRYYVEHFSGVGRVPGIDHAHAASKADTDSPPPAEKPKTSKKKKDKSTAPKPQKNQKLETPVSPHPSAPANARSVPLDSLQHLFRKEPVTPTRTDDSVTTVRTDTVPQVHRDSVPPVRRDSVRTASRDTTAVSVVRNAFRKTK